MPMDVKNTSCSNEIVAQLFFTLAIDSNYSQQWCLMQPLNKNIVTNYNQVCQVQLACH